MPFVDNSPRAGRPLPPLPSESVSPEPVSIGEWNTFLDALKREGVSLQQKLKAKESLPNMIECLKIDCERFSHILQDRSIGRDFNTTKTIEAIYTAIQNRAFLCYCSGLQAGLETLSFADSDDETFDKLRAFSSEFGINIKPPQRSRLDVYRSALKVYKKKEIYIKTPKTKTALFYRKIKEKL